MAEKDIRTVAVAPVIWCPCCGSSAKINSYPNATWTGPMAFHHVRCSKCGLQTADYRRPHEAAAAWNRRVHND